METGVLEKRIFFISDVHLGFSKDEPELLKKEKLCSFLDHVREAGGILVVAGDLFDFWYEWRHVVPKYWFHIIHKLRLIIEAGKQVFFITGNHDFEMGDYLQNEVGIQCFEESADLRIDGKKFFIGHGDGLAKKDRGYRFMKRLIRNRFSKFLFRTFIHPDLGITLARWASGSSRKLVNIDKSKWSEEYYEFALKKFGEGYDYVILGHLHTPLAREESGKIYVNLGDWITHFSYGFFDGTLLHLLYWDK